jgi:hypothetical protein
MGVGLEFLELRDDFTGAFGPPGLIRMHGNFGVLLDDLGYQLFGRVLGGANEVSL